MKEKLLRRLVSAISTFSLLFNSLFTPLAVLAQEASPTSEPTPTTIEETASPSAEPTVEATISATTEPTKVPGETILPTENPTQEPTQQTQEEQVQTNEPTGSSPSSTTSPSPEVKAVTTENVELDAIILDNTKSTSLNEFDFSIQQDGSATLITDKADYAPTDTALITGNGFVPNKEYTIEITSTTGNFKFSDKVTSDESGGLFYPYQLDGTYRPDYKVEVKSGGVIISSVTFTDSVPKITAKSHEGQKSDGSWTAGNITSYSEGQTINFRFNTKVENSPASGQLEIQFSQDDGVCLFFDNYFELGSINNVSGTTPSITKVSGPTATGGEWVVTLDISGSSDGEGEVNYQLKLSNEAGQCNGSSQHSRLNPAGGAVEQTGQQNVPVPANQVIELPDITVSKMVDRDGNGIFESNANIGEWSFTLDGTTTIATDVSGQVLFINVTNGSHSIVESSVFGYEFDSGSGTNCTFNSATATAVVASGTTPTNATCIFNNKHSQGTLRVTKVVNNNNGGTKVASDFSFQVNGGSLIAFETGGTNDLTVVPGTYSVIEPGVSGYATTYDNCTNVTVVTDQITTCTITNNDIQPKLTVIKVVVNDNGGNKEISDFPLFVDNTGVISGIENGFNVGTYIISETDQEGYTGTISGNCASNGSITLGLGDTKSCTITNDDIAPTITLIKNVIKDNGGTAGVNDFGLTIGGVAANSGQKYSVDANKEYAINEAGLAGYSFTSIAGTGCPTSLGGTVTLNPGQDIICTITNDDIPGKIIVDKVTNPLEDPQKFDFTLSKSTNLVDSFQLNDLDTPYDSGPLSAGNYSLVEDELTGWDLTSATCNDGSSINNISLSLGETVTCTFNNFKYPKLTVIKDLTPSNDPGKFNLLIGSTVYASNVGDGGTTGSLILNAGQYQVSETAGTDTSLSDYNISYSSNCANGEVNLSAGDNVTCTIYNTRKTGNIFFDKIFIGGTANDSDWTFTIFKNITNLVQGGLHDEDSALLNTGSYTVEETSSVLGYTLTSTGGVCPTFVGSTASLDVTESGGTCTFTNTRDTGSVTVNKKVDSDGDNTFEGGNSQANTLGFSFKVDTSQAYSMGSTVSGIETTITGVTHTVTENDDVSDYHFVGWFTTGSTGYSCNTPEGITLPVTVTVNKDVDTNITLCNAIDTATLTLEKVVNNNSGGTKEPSDWELSAIYDSNSLKVQGNGPSITGKILANKQYSLSESGPVGYSASSWSCTGGNLVNDNLTLSANSNVTCTITNDDQSATLIVKKVLVKDNGGNETYGNFTFKVNGGTAVAFESDGQNDLNVNAGTYSVVEPSVSGYSTGYNNCTDVVIPNGGTATCTITNNDIAPTITLIKDVTNDNGGDANPDDFSLMVGGNLVLSGSTTTVDANTSISLNETVLEGYNFVNITGDSKCPSVLGGSLTLDEGENVTCTIHNDDKTPHLTVVKNVVGSSAKVSGDFTMYIDGDNVSEDSFPGSSAGTTASLDVGSYIVSEDVVTGYTSSFSDDCDGSIALGENKTCTVTNTRDLGKIEVKKIIDEDGYITTTSDQTPGVGWVIDINGNSTDTEDPSPLTTDLNGENITDDIKTGEYLAIESKQDGYDLVTAYCKLGETFKGTYDNLDSVNGIILGEGETIICTFINTPNGSIHGYKWEDKDGNGIENIDDNPLGNWAINLYGWDNGTNDYTKLVKTTTTDTTIGSDLGWYWFNHLFPATYKVCEELKTGWTQTYPTDPNCHFVNVPQNNNNVVQNFGNFKLAEIGDFVWTDYNGNGIQDVGEPGISGVQTDLYLDNGDGIQDLGEADILVGSTTTDGSGIYLFTNLLPGNYWVDVVDLTVPTGYAPTTTDPYGPIAVVSGANFDAADFGFVPSKEVKIEKSNDKLFGARIGDEVIYTLKVKNTGNVTINNLEVIDILPGGFEYVSGSSLINDVSTSDPTITSGVLKWSIGDIISGQEIKITYKAKVLSSVFQGSSYKNFATCKGTIGSEEREESLETIECNVANSSVVIGTGIGYGGNLLGQVLGASIELPDTGSDTLWIIMALTMLGIGIYINRKYAKK
ncbi:hypothetical protein A2422_02770 [Candidatus Woesebacteria bacterium RIFOXYC1_FULL_31_51]|nr:MAG: hypothetical protein UR17_C0001G0059 [Candidatus Woesebacteria bacterium GW2011_GWF1_31_35]KKP23444.1 MAG: hypothetical protein UR11_C0001G0418 [Candidatus Woesebacteria bacterium GW2011_GWC1_30_29]KKP26421.1 MAG: hypothetical protein UR13_C0004G0035 [Candidatus Woesebacteria bacterium GW2011_GWD1_31_12]KKP27720.1 MAG: hypothetical protein UR16_C0002G0050 [Candidatus Woesebacteria bacterium GW2011_GWB1_31_29]KKP34240.1 MAG: hypothetical protein UR24_C0001G0305 [Candidatus Woesebacteria 